MQFLIKEHCSIAGLDRTTIVVVGVGVGVGVGVVYYLLCDVKRDLVGKIRSLNRDMYLDLGELII